MLSDQELNEMLDRSIQAGKAVAPDELEKQYNQLIHGLIGIHQHYVRGVQEMRSEIGLLQDCFSEMSKRFMK